MAGPNPVLRSRRDWSPLIVRPEPANSARSDTSHPTTKDQWSSTRRQTTRLLLGALCSAPKHRTPLPLALAGSTSSHAYSICDSEQPRRSKPHDRPQPTSTILKATWNAAARGITRTVRAVAKAPFSTAHDPTSFQDAKLSIDRAVSKLEAHVTLPYRADERALGKIAETTIDIALTLSNIPQATRALVVRASRLPRLGGLYRKVVNTGAFARFPVPLQHRVVRHVARLAGINMKDVKIKIVREPSHIGRNLLGYTHAHGKVIDLYPEAFSSVENLVKTLGHEYTHVYQIRTFGRPTSSTQGGAFERAARQIEETFWTYFQLHKLRGER